MAGISVDYSRCSTDEAASGQFHADLPRMRTREGSLTGLTRAGVDVRTAA